MYSAAIVFISVLIICYLILIPLEYRSLKAVKEMHKESDMSQVGTLDKQSLEEQLSQANKEGNILNVPAVAIASFIYKARHREA